MSCLRPLQCRFVQLRLAGNLGNGAGKGGGGKIRAAGAAFGKQASIKEEEYFYKRQKDHLFKLKDRFKYEDSYEEKQAKALKEQNEPKPECVEGLDKKV